MDPQLQEMFAQSYPKKSDGNNKPIDRTSLHDLMSRKTIKPTNSTNTTSSTSNSGVKKFLTYLLIAIVSAIIFSSASYTLSDGVANRMGMEMFDGKGQPGLAIMTIHTLILLILIYIIIAIMSKL
jgi:hypothetical protein